MYHVHILPFKYFFLLFLLPQKIVFWCFFIDLYFTQQKTKFCIGFVQCQNGLDQCQGLFCTDFNTGKNYGVVLRNFGEKNVLLQSITKLEALTVLNIDTNVEEQFMRRENEKLTCVHT